MATLAGGWAGAGPSSGFSGWNRTSGAVTSATPLTRKRTGFARGRGVERDRVAELSLERRRELLVEDDSAGLSEPCRKRNVLMWLV